MTDIATHIRIFDAEPTDELVEKRTSAIADLRAIFAKKKIIPEILQLANDLAVAVSTKDGVPTAMSDEVEAAIKSFSSAFVQDGQELQIIVCALLAAHEYLDTSKPSNGLLLRSDILAVGLWSALSYQLPRTEAKVETLREELLSVSQNLVIATSSIARERGDVPDYSFKLPETVDWVTFADALTKGSVKTIKALRNNAVLDREELDLLWWLLSDWSSLLEETWSSSSAEAAAIGRAIEAASLLRRLPGDAHKHLVLKGITKGEPLNLGDLIKALGDDRMKLASAFQGETAVMDCPEVFPLLSALMNGQVPETTANVKFSLRDWAGRALLESAILHVISLPNPVAI